MTAAAFVATCPRMADAKICGINTVEALDAAIELARTIADNGPLAVKKSKQVIVESGEWSEAEMWQKQTETLGNLFATNDAREGAAAFAEKRKPNWTGT